MTPIPKDVEHLIEGMLLKGSPGGALDELSWWVSSLDAADPTRAEVTFWIRHLVRDLKHMEKRLRNEELTLEHNLSSIEEEQ